MSKEEYNLVVLFIVILFIVFIIIIDYKYKGKMIKLKMESEKNIQLARAESVKASKSITRGKIAEEFLPLFPDFPYNLSDCKFSGQPLDYIVFKGMSDVRDGIQIAAGVEASEIEIIFADVKVNSSSRSKVQNAIKKAIEEKRVRFETWNVVNNKITIK